jgi:hypothetical protein
MDTIRVNEEVISALYKQYDYDDMSIVVQGRASTGDRSCTITIPILNEANQNIDIISVTLRGQDFNDFWSSYQGDEQAVEAVMGNIDADLSIVPQMISNVIKEPDPVVIEPPVKVIDSSIPSA